MKLILHLFVEIMMYINKLKLVKNSIIMEIKLYIFLVNF